MQARYIQRGESIDFLPDRDIAAGEIVIRNDLIGVARIPVKKGTLGSLALSGVFDVTKPVRCAFSVDVAESRALDLCLYGVGRNHKFRGNRIRQLLRNESIRPASCAMSIAPHSASDAPPTSPCSKKTSP